MNIRKSALGLAMIAAALPLQGCGGDGNPTREEIQQSMESAAWYEESEKAREDCRKRHDENPDSFLADPLLLAGRPAAERVRLILVKASGRRYYLSGIPPKLKMEGHSGRVYKLSSVNGKAVDLKPFSQTACHTDRMYIPVGQVELTFRIPMAGDPGKQEPLSFVLTVDPGEDIHLATRTILITEDASVLFNETTRARAVLLSALVTEVTLADMNSAGFLGTTHNGWYVTSSTFPEAENMSWDRATYLYDDHMIEGLRAQLPNIKSIVEFNMNPATLPHANTEIQRRKYVEDTKLSLEAVQTTAATGDFPYEGRYVLTRGDSCAEDMPLSRERFMEVSRDPEKDSLEYYVSFGGFLYDDANAITWPAKVGPDGSLQSVIEDPKPATGSSALQGPMTIQHRISLKPRDATHLAITAWTRTTMDPSGVYEPKTVDMQTYDNNWDKNPYIDYVGSDGYCLKRVGGVSG